MDSKDFRSKLRNHETPFNPEAWSQMEEMLNALPTAEVVEEKRDNKKWMLILLALLLLSLTGLVIFNVTSKDQYSNGRDKAQSSIEVTKDKSKNNEESALTDINTGSESISNLEEAYESQLANSKNKGQSEEVKKVQLDSKIDNNSNALTKLTERQSSEGGAQISNLQETKNTLRSSQDREQKKAVTTDTEKNSDTAISNTVGTTLNGTEKIDNSTIRNIGTIDTADNKADDKSKELNNRREPLDVQKSETSSKTGSVDGQSYTPNELFMEVLLLDMLKASPLQVQTRDKAELLPSFKIDLIKNRKLYYIGELGISDINSNRGYYIGTGIFWDIDKVLGLEPNLSFSSAWDINGNSNSPLESAQELNLTTWIHLNLWRTDQHKLSIEAAPSLGATWSTPKGDMMTRQYDGISPNYKLGASYTYFLSSGNGIGIKGVFSRFDSGFVSLRYYKKF